MGCGGVGNPRSQTVLQRSGVGIETDMLIPGIKLKTQKCVHTPMDSLFWNLETHTEEKTMFSTNGVGQTGRLHVEEWKQIYIYLKCS